MATRTYDPKLVILTFGNINVTGYFKGTFIEATRAEDNFKGMTGASGETARSKMNDRRGTVKCTLMATSQTNDFLSAVATVDEQTAAGQAPLQMKDLNGTLFLHATSAWVQKWPDVKKAEEVEGVEWIFECAELDVFIGGLL